MSTASAIEPTRPSTDWQAVFIAAFCGIAVAINVGKVPVAMVALREHFGLSLVSAGWVSSTINILSVSLAICFGLLGDRLGALRMCYGGLGISIAGGLLGLLASNAPTLMASRMLEGAGVVAVAVSAPALISQASNPSDRRFALGIWSGYLPGGVGLIMLLAPLLVPIGGWQALWWCAIAALTLALAGVRLSHSTFTGNLRTSAAVTSWKTARTTLGEPTPWLLALSMASWTTQHFALIIWLPTFLNEQRDLSLQAASLLSCLMVLVNVPGNLLGGCLLQRGWSRGTLILTANLITGLAAAGVFLDVLPDHFRYLLCLLISFTGGIIPACVLSASAQLARSPRQIGTLQGLFMQISNIGPLAGPPLVASLVTSSGRWSDALWVPGLAATVGLVLGIALRRIAPSL